MKISDIITKSFEGIGQYKVRTGLTAGAVSIGAVSILLTMALGNGARNITEQLTAATLNPRVLSVFAQSKDSANQTISTSQLQPYDEKKAQAGETQTQQLLTQADIDKISKIEGVERVIPDYVAQIEYMEFEGKKYTTPVERFKPYLPPEIIAGNLNNFAEFDITLPESYLAQLGNKSPQQMIGKKVALVYYNKDRSKQERKDYTIKAILKKPLTDQIPSLPSISEAAIRHISEFNTNNERKYSSADVLTPKNASPEQRQATKEAIANAGFGVTTSQESAKGIYDIINGIQLFLTAFAAATLLAAMFGIVNTELIGVLERKQEIGLLKALGIHNRSLFSIFILESIWIGIIGYVIGLFIAVIGTIFLNPALADITQFFSAESPALIFSPNQLFIVFVILIGISVLAGFLPARRATKTDPIEVLRTE